MKRTGRWGIAAVMLLVSVAAYAQFGRGGRGGGGFRGRLTQNQFDFPEHGEFHFLRLEYTDYQRRGFGFVSRRGQATGWWAQDYPDAENHFTLGLRRLTRIDPGEPRHVGLLDPELYDYPWIYATQTGYMDLSDEEIEKLGDYLRRGGFLMTDDMFGQEWSVFEDIVRRALPGSEIEDMTEADPMMHVHYDIQDKDRTFIPGDRHLYGGRINQPGPPGWFKVSDEKGRVVIALNYNTDMGDAWEFADDPYYPAEMTTLAYHYGINYVIYAMTH
jgi:hypothetical protein